MWELDHKKDWMPKNWCFSAVVLEEALESLLDCKVKPVNPKGNQSWIFIRRTDAEAEAQPPDVKSQFIRKDPDAGKDWGQEEKGMPEDKMIGWYHRFNGHEFEQAPGDGEGQGSLVCYSPWGHKESTRTEQLNNTTILNAEFQTNTSIERASWYKQTNWDPFNKQTLKCEVLKS